MNKINLKEKCVQLQIKDILSSDKKIFVPIYQRAYSWEVKNKSDSDKKQIDIFLEDIKNHINSRVISNFYLGNFLFQESEKGLAIIDGQQRLTTIIILLSVIKNITGEVAYDLDIENFSTTEYDNENLKKIISGQIIKENTSYTLTNSTKKIINAYNFFKKSLEKLELKDIKKIENALLNASCQINIISSEIEATQIFIFENNRGVELTNLEIIKSMFMHYIYINEEEISFKDEMILNIELKFSSIYKNISYLEGYIREEAILGIAFRIYKQKLKLQENIINEIEENISVEFINNFLSILENTFSIICNFILQGNDDLKDEEIYMIHSLINLGISQEIYPIIVRVRDLKVKDSKILIRLYKALEAILLRHNLVSTRANISQRLEWEYSQLFEIDDYENKNEIEEKIINLIEIIEKLYKSRETVYIDEDYYGYWWSYWTQDKFEIFLNNGLNNLKSTKYILWKYENYLRTKMNLKKIKYNEIKNYQVEHIAPKTENKNNINGYPIYNEEFYSKYLNSFGNLLLLKEYINKKIGNADFEDKLKEYSKNNLYQSTEKELLKNNKLNKKWTVQRIKEREKEIKDFINRDLS